MRSLVSSFLDRVRARPWARRLLFAGPIVAMFSLFVVTGVRGVDYGHHWDEVDWQIQPVRGMVASGLLLPRATIYPAFSKWLVLLPALPAAIKTGLDKKSDPRRVQAAMLAAVDAPGYLLTVRRLFVVFSALALVWVWAAALALRRPAWEAFVAAAGLGLSWEYAYHARYVATDCLVVQFSALTLFMLALYFRARRPLWLYAAAVAAGLGTGAKFPAVILLVPVMLTSALTLPVRAVGRQALRLAALGALAFAAYLITTPATVFDPFAFVEQLRLISKHYETGHWGYSVPSGWHHVGLVLVYLAFSYFSPYRVVALALFASAIVGAIFWVRSDRRLGAVLICFPVAFLFFFCFRYQAMIARNYLLIVPFLSLFAARGLTEVGGRLPYPWLRLTLAGVVGAAFVAGAAWLVSAGESIRHVDPKDEVRQAVEYVAKHPGTRFKLSPRVKALAQQQNLPLPPNAKAESGGQADQVILFPQAEGPDPGHRKTNDPFLTKATFGPREMNYNWYSTWDGHDRVVVMTIEKARDAGILLAK